MKKYYVALIGEGVCEGYIELTDEEAAIIKWFLCVSNWEDVHDEAYSPQVVFKLVE